MWKTLFTWKALVLVEDVDLVSAVSFLVSSLDPPIPLTLHLPHFPTHFLFILRDHQSNPNLDFLLFTMVA